MQGKDAPSQPTIFYSWQSDDNETKKYISKNLAKVLKDVDTSTDTELSPRKDQDTQGTVGAVSIAETILQKIDTCSIFLADVTIVGSLKDKRQVNQNVMFELGYAAKSLKFQNIIMVANVDNGHIDELPFDIRNRRVIAFSLKDDPDGKLFRATLKYAVQLHLEQIIKELSGDELSEQKAALISAAEHGKPTKRIAEKYGRVLFRRIADKAPSPYIHGEDVNEYSSFVLERYGETLPDILDFAETVATLVEYNEGKALIALLAELQAVTRFLDPQPNGGGLYEITKDFYSLIAYEVIALTLGNIVDESYWEILPDIFKVRFLRTSEYDKPRDISDTYHYPSSAVKADLTKRNISDRQGIRPLIAERYSDEGWMLKHYITGSIVRWIVTDDYPWAVNFVVGYDRSYKYEPTFFEKLKSKTLFNVLLQLSDTDNPSDYKRRLWNRLEHSFSGWSSETLASLLKDYGINSEKDLGSE